MGVREDAQGEVLERVRLALPSFGELVECFDHEVEIPRCKLRHVFAQYADRTQLDVNIASVAPAHVPRVIVLYDPENVVTVLGDDALDPKPDEVRLWAFESWVALANVGKYLRRSSFWEAERELELARANLFRLWALAEQVAQARYGVTALLDTEGAALPPGIERSLPGDNLSALLSASVYLAEQLHRGAGAPRRTASVRSARRLCRLRTRRPGSDLRIAVFSLGLRPPLRPDGGA
jgi:hypothetical protein